MSQREGWRRATPLRKLEIPTVCAGRRLRLVPEPVRELCAGADAELPIGARQRALDGVLGDEEGRGDLAVGAALGDERRDPALGLGQLTARGRAPADPRQLAPCLLGPERGAEPLEDGERLLERQAGGAALLRSPLRDALREQRTRVLERILSPRVLGQRALEARLGAREIAARGEEERAATGRDRQRPRAVERPGALLPRYELPLGLRRARRPRSAPPACPPGPSDGPARERGRCHGSPMHVRGARALPLHRRARAR